ncbi:MAG: TIGR03032 family protein [Cyanobacteria bacterium J06634_6]
MIPLSPSNPPNAAALREVRYEYSNNFVPLLAQLGASLLVSTYQAGKLIAVGVHNQTLQLSFHNFERAMGLAIGPNQIAVGGSNCIYFLKNAPDIAPRIDPVGTYDACFTIRGAQYTNDIAVHEMAWGQKELLLTNTRFSCLSTLHNRFNFLPQWRPDFISALAPEDRCHLNGIALHHGKAKYVSVFGLTDTAGGWRDRKATHGCVIEVDTGNVVARGLSMPHSPRFVNGRLWVLNSGRGEMASVDLSSGRIEPLLSLPGYPRGLAIAGQFAFVGLSKVREKETFGNLPISAHADGFQCGVAIIDLKNAQQIGCLSFHSGVEEIFDVQLLPGVRNPYIAGPYATVDGTPPIWLLPQQPSRILTKGNV